MFCAGFSAESVFRALGDAPCVDAQTLPKPRNSTLACGLVLCTVLGGSSLRLLSILCDWQPTTDCPDCYNLVRLAVGVALQSCAIGVTDCNLVRLVELLDCNLVRLVTKEVA